LEQPLQLQPGETQRLTFTLAPSPAPPPPDPEAEALAAKNRAIGAYNDGVIRLQLNDLDGAIVKFAEAAELDPALPEAQAALADLYVEKGRHAEALAAADRYLTLRPEDRARVAATRYDAAEALGDTAAADAALEELMKLRPGRDTAVRAFNKGVGLLRANQPAAAIAILQRVLEVDPTLAKAHYLLGVAHAQAGDKVAARTQLEKFLELSPQDADAGTAKKLLTSLSGG
jgi:tetratricopeptide (TPR) repeat protein